MGERKRFFITAGALLGLLGLTAYLSHGHWTPSRRTYPVQGIDVSHHQGRIEWAKLPAQGVDFAYIKATEGGDYRDRLFAENWMSAKTAGVPRGAYHFFTLCRPGKVQAANFIAAVPKDDQAIAPAVDLEFLGNCTSQQRMSKAQLHRELGAFLTAIEAHSGKRALLYLTEEFDRAYEISSNIDRPLWLRNLVLEPRFGPRPWALWQASNFRRLEGISGRVDWNVADLTRNELPPLSRP